MPGIGRLMAKGPSDRFESAEEVAQLLGECLAHGAAADGGAAAQEL